MKIMMVFGTRPEAIKMAPLALALRNDGRFECCICVTAQHRELMDGVLEFFGLKPDIDLDLMHEGQTAAQTVSQVLARMEGVFTENRPDMVLVHGDTATSLAAALAAFYSGIPVGHVEAGLRTGNRLSPFPEEMDRRLISRIAELHFAPSELNRKALLAEGTDPSKIFVTGNTAIDALRIALSHPEAPLCLPLSGGVLTGAELEGKRIVVLTCHRRENLGRNMQQIFAAVNRSAKAHPDVLFIYPVHPNPEVRQAAQQLLGHENIRLTEPIGYAQMVALLKRCCFVVTDSGGLQEEAPALGKPVVVIRNETERPEAVSSGNAVLAGTDEQGLFETIEKLLTDEAAYASMARSENIYGDGFAAERIADILGSI